ncbi:MAG: S26 family signal peptidase, partial [Spirochaetaceae bacterium]
MTFPEFQDHLVKKTESLLTWNKRRRLSKEHKERQRHPVVEWGLSLFFIILLVMVINMFLFQNYRIPSESMLPGLEVGDLIFVEKVAAGPEILPGVLKIPNMRNPLRGEVVSFES